MTVSILIPAFRPTYLRQAVASVLTQGTEHFEVLISDDSGGEDLLPIVESFRDPRIRYTRTAGRIGGAENCRFLWEQCERDVMMFLFDDDLLMPHAMADLTDALAAHPQASFCYGQRYVIDNTGRITQTPSPPPQPLALIPGDALTRALVGGVVNRVGELSNVLINRKTGVVVEDLLVYFGVDLHVVADVGLYLNATRRGPAAQIGRPIAAFRRHEAQNSQASFNPKFAIGIVEWELFLRGEWDVGRLPAESALAAVEKLTRAYGHWGQAHPAIGAMLPGLQALPDRIRAGDRQLLDPAFRASWDGFVADVLKPKAA